jgi:hypothetical protein
MKSLASARGARNVRRPVRLITVACGQARRAKDRDPMIERITDLPDNVLGLVAKGELNRDNYENVLNQSEAAARTWVAT